MPKPSIDLGTVERIQALRRAGFSFGEIAEAVKLPRSAVIYHCSSIKVRNDGHTEVMRILADLVVELEPGRPFKEPPLPNAVIARLKRLSEIMRQ